MSCQTLPTPSSAAVADTRGQDEAVSEMEDSSCFALNLESQPGSKCAEGKDLLYETRPPQ